MTSGRTELENNKEANDSDWGVVNVDKNEKRKKKGALLIAL